MDVPALIDPQLAEGLSAFPALGDLSSETLPAARAMMTEIGRQQAEMVDRSGIRLEEHRIPHGDGHAVRVLLYHPEVPQSPMAAYLHVHGGGLVMGTPEISLQTCVDLVRRFGLTVVSVDYRLAPEHPYPAAVEDCYRALHWLYAKAEELGVDRDRIVVGGESAGGGLAAALCVLARDRGEVRVAFQHLTYPMLDDRTTSPYSHPHAGRLVWTQPSNEFGWRAYLSATPGGKDTPAYAAAARTERLEGLPPAFIATGALDLFLEENIEYARRLVRAGVPTELHVYPGAFHAFDMITDAKVSQAFRNDWRRALERALSPGRR
ncbi:MAG: alpha/beta hydrolase [Alphaproteobacteria bacterium]|nr:alpha/beta hydrolase [Alphaproteobacteria bacterium]